MRAPNRRVVCKQCKKRRDREYYLQNKDAVKKVVRENYVRNRKSRLEYAKQYRSENKDKIQNWIDSNREKWIGYREREKKLRHPIKVIYRGMIQRCYDKNSISYPAYGGRGIRVCDRWLGPDGFGNFVEDVYKGYSSGLSLDRYPDNNGNYEPSNVRWATALEQANNRRSNLVYHTSISESSFIEWNGRRMSLAEFSETTKIHLTAVKYRYGLRPDDPEWIINPFYERRNYRWNGRKYTITELSLISGLPYHIIRNRICGMGWDAQTAMTTPIAHKSRKCLDDD